MCKRASSVNVENPREKVLSFLQNASNRIFDAENVECWNANAPLVVDALALLRSEITEVILGIQELES